MTCVGMTFLISACAIPNPKIFYPFFVILFYVLTVLPVFITNRLNSESAESNPKSEFALFLTAGMLLSAFAFPIVLARSHVITWFACILTLFANVFNYLTIFGYAFNEIDESSYGNMF